MEHSTPMPGVKNLVVPKSDYNSGQIIPLCDRLLARSQFVIGLNNMATNSCTVDKTDHTVLVSIIIYSLYIM